MKRETQQFNNKEQKRTQAKKTLQQKRCSNAVCDKEYAMFRHEYVLYVCRLYMDGIFTKGALPI